MPEVLQIDPAIKIYNLNYAVGDGCANKSDDVMLVQWLLKRHFERGDKKALLGNIWSIPVVNGVYCQTLSDIIKIYQYDVIMSNRGCKADIDGKIFPVRQVAAVNKYPLFYMNLSVGHHYKNFYKNPKTDPYVHSAVKPIFDKCSMS
jgi:hypothetical protein